jgi:predicted small lipoprotein YifL
MRILLILAALLSALGVAACGKRGAPSAPGPADQITWPKVYPAL